MIARPYQQPHRPLYHAATTRETFAAIDTLGLPLLVGVASLALQEIPTVVAENQAAWHEAGHPGQGAVRAARAAQLATLTYEDVLQTRVAFGTLNHVTERLNTLRHKAGLAGIIMEPNIGGRMPPELILRSMRLFAQEVAPHVRSEREGTHHATITVSR